MMENMESFIWILWSSDFFFFKLQESLRFYRKWGFDKPLWKSDPVNCVNLTCKEPAGEDTDLHSCSAAAAFEVLSSPIGL